MSLYRLVACRRLGISTINTAKTGHLVRWQSSGAPRRGGLRKVVISLAVTGTAVGGVLAYSNYNPVFKNQVNERIPGFASLSDKTADIWVDITGYFNPKPQGGKKKDAFMIEHNQAKVKARLDELKKNAPVKNAPAAPPTPDSAATSVDKKKAKEKDTGEGTELKPNSEKTQEIKSEAKLEQKPGKKSEREPGKKSEPTKEKTPKGSEAKKKDTKEVVKEKPTKPSEVPVDPKEKDRGEKAAPEESSVAEALPPSPPPPESAASKPTPSAAEPKIGSMLDEAHKKFLSDVVRVTEAQESFFNVLEKQHAKFTSSDFNKEGKEKSIAEARSVISATTAELKAASEELNSSSQQLEQLIDRAAEQGLTEKVSAIASDMAEKETELDVMNFAVSEYRQAVRESKDALKELGEDAAKIKMEYKDGELQAQQNKLELLDHQLKESEAQQEKKLAQALEAQKKALEELTQRRLDQALRESKARHQRELIDEMNKISGSYNSMLREQLRLETESHLKTKKKALEDQAKKLSSRWSSEMDLRLSMQEGFYQTELARAMARLGGLHATVNGVLSAGQKTIKLQALRNSCDTLSDTLDRIDCAPDVVDRYTIGAEVVSLRRAAGEDTFFATVLDAVPSQAIAGDGFQSMASLRERFTKVKRICRRVALVPETGGGLGTYAISYLQSLLTIRAWFPDASATSDPSEMHTYQLLHQADARLRRGDLDGAIHYMNHLQGEPKNIARDWLVDARLYLETRQAVQLIQTCMAASSARPVLNLDNEPE